MRTRANQRIQKRAITLTLAAVLASGLAALGQTSGKFVTTTDAGVLFRPTNFFDANIAAISNAISLSLFVPTTRTVSTANSLTGGGALSGNLTLSLVGDTASPGNSRYYGTDSGGTRGFFAVPVLEAPSNGVAHVRLDAGWRTNDWSTVANKPSTFAPSAHQASHQSGGGDALTGLLDATARVVARKNSGADVGARRRINLIEGANITLTVTDDAGSEEVDVTVASTASGGGLGVNGSPVTNPNLIDNWAGKWSATSSNIVSLPQEVQSASTSSWTPDFAQARVHEVTMTGNLTISVPTGTTSDMIGHEFTLILVQDSTGNRTLAYPTNFMAGQEITSIGISTNAGSRSYVRLFTRRTNVWDIVGNPTGYPQ